MLLASQRRRFGVLFKPMRSPVLHRCAAATDLLQLQLLLLRPSSPSHLRHRGIPPTACDSRRSRRQPRQQEDPACSHDSKRIPPAAKGSFPLSSARRRPVTFTQVSPATHDARLRWKLPPSPSCCPPRRWRLKFAHSESEVLHLFNYFLLIFIRAVEHLFAPNNNNDRFLALKEHVMGMNFWH